MARERGREMEDKREEKIWAREEGDKEERKRAAAGSEKGDQSMRGKGRGR